MVVSDLSDERYAKQRGSMLARQLDLRKVEAMAVAYAERGYSRSGIAKEMDTSEGTVEQYHQKAMALYGFEILETKDVDNELPEYERVDADYFRSRPRADQKTWVKMVLDENNRLPMEFVNDVKENALADGLRV